MQMPGRKFGKPGRYGFNGKENDSEVEGQQDYGMRIYDKRLGRFKSRDPLTAKYAELTPYQFASNTPIQAVDLDGAESMFGWSIGTTPQQANDAVMGWTTANTKIVTGTASGVTESLTNTWKFFTCDAWKTSTWKNGALFVEESILGMSMIKVTPTPRVDAAVQDFSNNMIYGDAYTRSRYIGAFGTDLFTGYVGGKIVKAGKLGIAKYMSGNFIIGPKTLQIVTEHLAQFGNKAENTIMLERMQKIARKEMKATEIDINFAKHELRESELMKSGMKQEDAHYAVLKEQNMFHRDYEKKLYTEEALKAGNEQLLREYKPLGND